MEPNLITQPKNLEILKELMKRGPIFHHPEFGTTRGDFKKMIDPTFWEVGASAGVTAVNMYWAFWKNGLRTRPVKSGRQRIFHCLEIAQDNYLLTYTLIQKERTTRRATIWRRSGSNWKIVYHQGTIVDEH